MISPMQRRYVAEFTGVFGIVFPVCVLAASGHFPGGDGGLVMAAIVPAFAVVALVYTLGHISAAHFNPAVTLGLASADRFPWRYVLPYWIAQFAGAIAGAGMCTLLFGSCYGATIPTSGPLLRDVALEIGLTFILMFVVMAVATDKRVTGHLPVLGVGMAVFIGVMVGGPISGGSMNPARSLGPAIFSGHHALEVCWIFLVGPCIGAVLAARLYEAIRGDESHAKSAPNDLYEALQEIEVEAHQLEGITK